MRHEAAHGRAPRVGILAALGAGVLFGAGIPFSKMLAGAGSPVLLAGLLYLGAGSGLTAYRWLRPDRGGEAGLRRDDWPWMAGAILSGGVAAPVLLLFGLRHTPGSTAALLGNLEAVATAGLAWFIFSEHFDRRIAAGMLLIVAGGMVLSWQTGSPLAIGSGMWAVVAAYAAWGLDNNLTQKVSASDPIRVASVKGLAAGVTNGVLAVLLGARLPAGTVVAGALGVGLLAYGASLALFVLALRHIGTARTGAYFSIAPFVGSALSVALLGEPVTGALLLAAGLMGGGVWLHLTERHAHAHDHDLLVHAHRHLHDDHHDDHHPAGEPACEPHSHPHMHPPMTHWGPHYPDLHHRHRHEETPEG